MSVAPIFSVMPERHKHFVERGYNDEEAATPLHTSTVAYSRYDWHFAVGRNPMQLGMTHILLGIGVLVGSFTLSVPRTCGSAHDPVEIIWLNWI